MGEYERKIPDAVAIGVSYFPVNGPPSFAGQIYSLYKNQGPSEKPATGLRPATRQISNPGSQSHIRQLDQQVVCRLNRDSSRTRACEVCRPGRAPLSKIVDRLILSSSP